MNQNKTIRIILAIVIGILIVAGAWYWWVGRKSAALVPYQQLSPAAREKVLESLQSPVVPDDVAPLSNQTLERLRGTSAPSVSDAERERVLRSLTP